MLKRVLIMVSVLLLLSSALFGVGATEDDGTTSIAFVGFSSTNEFWLTLARSADARATEQGVDFINLTSAEPDASAQVAAVENAILQNVDGIIIGAADSRAFDNVLDRAADAGIPVIAVDTGIDHPHVSSLIQTDNLAAARLAGEYIVEQTGGQGKLLIIGGAAGHQTGDARKNGVEEIATEAGIQVIVEYADWLENKAADIMQNQLGANPDINAVFAAWDPGAVAALAQVKQAGRLDDIVLVGFDALPVALSAIAAGEMEATVRQDPVRMGREGIDLMLQVINGEDVPEYTPIDGVIIDESNVSEYR
jgi:ribose transport system substrate-binding protein